MRPWVYMCCVLAACVNARVWVCVCAYVCVCVCVCVRMCENEWIWCYTRAQAFVVPGSYRRVCVACLNVWLCVYLNDVSWCEWVRDSVCLNIRAVEPLSLEIPSVVRAWLVLRVMRMHIHSVEPLSLEIPSVVRAWFEMCLILNVWMSVIFKSERVRDSDGVWIRGFALSRVTALKFVSVIWAWFEQCHS